MRMHGGDKYIYLSWVGNTTCGVSWHILPKENENENRSKSRVGVMSPPNETKRRELSADVT